MYEEVLFGLLGGAAVAAAGYAKAAAGTKEKFIPLKFGLTTVIGGVVGAALVLGGKTDALELVGASGFVTYFVESLYKAFVKKTTA